MTKLHSFTGSLRPSSKSPSFFNFFTVVMNGEVSHGDGSELCFQLHGYRFFVLVEDGVKISPDLTGIGIWRMGSSDWFLGDRTKNPELDQLMELFPCCCCRWLVRWLV